MVRLYVCLLIHISPSLVVCVCVWTTAVATVAISIALWKDLETQAGYLHIINCGARAGSVHKLEIRAGSMQKCSCNDAHCDLRTWDHLQQYCKDCVASLGGALVMDSGVAMEHMWRKGIIVYECTTIGGKNCGTFSFNIWVWVPG